MLSSLTIVSARKIWHLHLQDKLIWIPNDMKAIGFSANWRVEPRFTLQFYIGINLKHTVF